MPTQAVSFSQEVWDYLKTRVEERDGVKFSTLVNDLLLKQLTLEQIEDQSSK